MQIIIKTKNLELTESLESFIQKRMSGVAKFINQSAAELFIEVEKESKHHNKGEVFCAKVYISLPKKKIVARATGEDLGKAITEMKKELEMEIKKYKTKIIETPRREAKKSRKEMF